MMDSPEVQSAENRRRGRADLLDLSRNRLIRRFSMLLLLMIVAYATYLISKKAYTLLVTDNPTKGYDSEERKSSELQSLKSEILTELNQEISQDKRQKIYGRFRILAALRSFFRSLPGHRVESARQKASLKDERDSSAVPTRQEEANRAELTKQPVTTLSAGPHDKVQLQPLLIAKDHLASHKDINEYVRSSPLKANRTSSKDAQVGDTDAYQELPGLIKPLEGVNTKGIAWKVNRRIMLEGIFDASLSGHTERDLQDFGLRSMHAQALLEQASRPEFLFGKEKIDSGFPRSFGVGINLELSPSVNLIFDYVHEFSNDYYIEYTGNWESSLVTDYSRLQPDDKNATHTFFLGMRYLHKSPEYLVPFHTGFFYTTTMAETPLKSDVSLGFSLGTGLYLKHVSLGVAYRMRIWETPNGLAFIDNTPELSKRMTNQFLFQANF